MVERMEAGGCLLRFRRDVAAWSRYGYRFLCGFLSLILLSMAEVSSRAQDGGALMRMMIDAYQHLNSYAGKADVDLILADNGKPIHTRSLSVLMRVKRPNKLVLTVRNQSDVGTQSVYSDGKTLTTYTARPNQYSTGPAAPDLHDMLPLLHQRAHLDATNDPLLFLSTSQLPSTMTGFKSAGSAVINGHPSFVVTTTVAPLWKRPTERGAKAGDMRSTITHWTWYIDKKTFLLNRVEMHSDPIAVSTPVRQGNTMTRRTLSLVATLRHTVSSAQANPPLADSLFVFKAPPGATIQKPESAPEKGGK